MARRSNKSIQEVLGQSNGEFILFDIDDNNDTKAAYISAITEELLKSVTHEPKGKSDDDVVKAYEDLFTSMEPLVRKYNLQVEVGRYAEYYAGARPRVYQINFI